MNNLRSTLRRLVRSFTTSSRGANMVEYLVVVGLVALGAIAAFKGFSSDASNAIKGQGTTVKGLGGGAGGGKT